LISPEGCDFIGPMADAFISYAKKDKQFASTLADALTTSGCTVWWDRDIEHGKYFDRVIEREIQSATVVIVVWSIAGRESDWCRAEAAAALEQSKLLPISIQQAKPPMRFMHLHTGDLSNGRAIRQLRHSSCCVEICAATVSNWIRLQRNRR
jgi:hypothetical protein